VIIAAMIVVDFLPFSTATFITAPIFPPIRVHRAREGIKIRIITGGALPPEDPITHAINENPIIKPTTVN
jgi:hypothetical protein